MYRRTGDEGLAPLTVRECLAEDETRSAGEFFVRYQELHSLCELYRTMKWRERTT
jgi:hypothetical protein